MKGIAITGASSSNGHWEYSADGVNNWTQISGVATDTALLLDESYSLRFASTGPDGVTATLDFVAWTKRTQTVQAILPIQPQLFSPSTISPFSVDSNTLSLEVTDLNDAPELGGVTTNLGTITENDADSSEDDVTTFDLVPVSCLV